MPLTCFAATDFLLYIFSLTFSKHFWMMFALVSGTFLFFLSIQEIIIISARQSRKKMLCYSFVRTLCDPYPMLCGRTPLSFLLFNVIKVFWKYPFHLMGQTMEWRWITHCALQINHLHCILLSWLFIYEMVLSTKLTPECNYISSDTQAIRTAGSPV